MTHDGQCTAFESMIQLLADEGFEGMAEAIAILVNEAMKIERAEALNAEPYEVSSIALITSGCSSSSSNG